MPLGDLLGNSHQNCPLDTALFNFGVRSGLQRVSVPMLCVFRQKLEMPSTSRQFPE
jgi:hypothetical protein